MTRVGACVVAWNAAARLPRLLRSLEAERARGADLEVVVVDNASTDGTAALVRRDFAWVKLVESPRNAGYAAGQALAAAGAGGEALLFLNDDLELPPGAIAALEAELAAHPEAVAVGPALVGEDGQVQRSAGPLPTLGAALHRLRWLRWTGLARRAHQAFRRAPLPPAGPVACLMGAALLVRREAYQRAPWDPGFPFGLEDADLSARLGALGALRYAPAVRAEHTGGVASAANPARVLRGYEQGWVRFVARHDPRAWAGPLLALGTALDLPLRAVLLVLRALGLVLRGRGRDARAALGQGAATAWLALTGLPGLMGQALPQGPGAARAVTRALVALWPFALAGGLALGYWPVLRTVAPQLAVDAAFQAGVVQIVEWRGSGTLGGSPLVRVDELVVAEDARDPWGRAWPGRTIVSHPGATGPLWPHAISPKPERVRSAWVALFAIGPRLLFALGGLMFALDPTSPGTASGATRAVVRAVRASALGVPAICWCGEYARHQLPLLWLGGGAALPPSWRFHGTIAVGAFTLLLALRLWTDRRDT